MNREGYFLTGNYTHSPSAWPASPARISYIPGMYLYRPGDSINGGPESVAETTSIWFFRELSESIETTHERCESYRQRPTDAEVYFFTSLVIPCAELH